MSFLAEHYGISKKEINDAEQIAFSVLEHLIEKMNMKSDRDVFYKDDLKKHFDAMKSKMEDEKRRIRCDDYSLRHMVDIADILRSIVRHKTETKAHDLNDCLYNQETFYTVMRFIATCHRSKSKWEDFDIQAETIYKLHDDLCKM